LSYVSDKPKAPSVSIVTAVNYASSGEVRQPDLRPWFRALCNQTLPAESYEVIIADSKHTLDYGAALARFRAEEEVRVRVICRRTERGGRALALNRALELAAGDLVVFLGDDFLPPPGFAEAHQRFHEEHPEREAVGVGTALLPPEYRNPFSVWLEESGELFGVPFRADITEVPEEFFYVANASVKRGLLERAGRFDERFAHHAWDDFEYGQRLRALGARARLVPGARAAHVHHINLPERERSLRDAGAAARVLVMSHPGDYAWLEGMRLPAWRHRLQVASARARLAATRTERARVVWWRARLNAALAEGYRNGA
jgi:GT2 family glycosyltransferase